MKKRLKDWALKEGVGLEDEMVFFPVQGKKQRICLLRTEYQLDNSKESVLRLWGKLNKGLRLYWKPFSNEDKKGLYYAESTGLPFIHNGHYQWKTVLGHGDEIFIGYNRLLFLRRKEKGLRKKSISNEEESIYRSDLNIVLEGETGVGKTYLAEKIHEKSKRIGRFVHVNLSSFSKSLLESELFGHVKGAYTGAISSKKGAILEADQGTLFLDEIDSLPLEVQLKLLLFLDHKRVRQVGGSQEKKVDVRLIFASGTSLEKCLKEGKMRKDFFYRITGGHRERILSLREQREKITCFCESYLEGKGMYISHKLLKFYEGLHWPGNLRQLKAHLDKKILLSLKGRKLVFDKWDEELLSLNMAEGIKDDFSSSLISVKELKNRYLVKTYYRYGSLKTAGKKLGVSEKTVKNALKSLEGVKRGNFMLQ